MHRPLSGADAHAAGREIDCCRLRGGDVRLAGFRREPNPNAYDVVALPLQAEKFTG